MTLFLNILIVILCLVIIGSVLLQPAKGGAVFGSSQSVFGSSGSTTFLFRVTMVSAFIIMILSLFLAWSHTRKNRDSVIKAENLSAASTAIPSTTTEAPAAAQPVAPAAPQEPTAPSQPKN